MSEVPNIHLQIRDIAKTLRFEGDPEDILECASISLTENKLHEMPALEAKKLAQAVGVGSQFSIVDAVDKQYATLAVAFARQLIEEYACHKPSEIAIAETAAVDHVRFIEYSKLSTIYKRDPIVLREQDRAHRRFLSSIGALRQMKRPPVSVRVVAEQAFVAQNQVNQA